MSSSQDRLQAFIEKMGVASSALLIVVDDKLGLYRTLAQARPRQADARHDSMLGRE